MDRDSFIRLAASGEKVEIAVLELATARSARLQAEKRRLAAEQARRRANEQAQKELSTFRPY